MRRRGSRGSRAAQTLRRGRSAGHRHPEHPKGRRIAQRYDKASDLGGLGLDSVDLLELLIACEHELGRQLPTDLLVDEAMTVGDLVRKLQSPAR